MERAEGQVQILPFYDFYDSTYFSLVAVVMCVFVLTFIFASFFLNIVTDIS